MSLINKLSEIQKKLKAPKDQFNNFRKYSYRSCEDILKSAKPYLDDCILTLSDEIVQLGDRFYVKATATLADDTNSIHVSAFAREDLNKKGMDQAQLTGSCSSYARKYALNGLFLLDDTKEIDSMDNKKASEKPKSSPQQPKKPSEDIIPDGILNKSKDELLEFIKGLRVDYPELMEKPLTESGLRGTKPEMITKDMLINCIERFNVEIVK